jgi:hypothetical protein
MTYILVAPSDYLVNLLIAGIWHFYVFAGKNPQYEKASESG